MSEWKDTEFGKIPNDWNYKPLENYFDLITYGFTNPMPTTKEGPYMLTAKDIFDGRIQYDSARRTSQEAYETLLSNKSRPMINDVLITKDGSIGRVGLVEKEGMCISQSVALIRPNSNIRPLFLKYLLEAPQYQQIIRRDAGGSTIEHVYITRINKMLVGVPDLRIQDAILRIVHNIQLKINLLQNQNIILEQLSDTIFRQLLVEEAIDYWKESNFSEIIDQVKDRVKDLTSLEPDIKVLSAVKTSELVFSEDYFTKQVYSKDIGKYIIVKQFDFAYNPSRINIGSIGMLSHEITGAVSPVYVVFRPKKGWHYFIQFMLKQQNIKTTIEIYASGSVRQSLDYNSFSKIEIKLPPFEKVKLFNIYYSESLTKVNANKHQIQTLTKLRDSLLPKLMSGELKVNN